MPDSPRLTLPQVETAQARKHVSYNEAIRILDAIVQLSVLDWDLTAPPASPKNGDQYIIAIGATGAWAGRDNQIAAFQNNAWTYYAPGPGWRCFILDENRLVYWDGAVWTAFAGGSGGGATNLGAIRTATAVTITSDSGANALLPAADGSSAGVLPAADKVKLDAIEPLATVDQTATEIVTAIDTELGGADWQSDDINGGNF